MPHDSSGVVNKVLCGREDAKKYVRYCHRRQSQFASRLGMPYRLCRTPQEGNLDPAIVFPWTCWDVTIPGVGRGALGSDIGE